MGLDQYAYARPHANAIQIMMRVCVSGENTIDYKDTWKVFGKAKVVQTEKLMMMERLSKT